MLWRHTQNAGKKLEVSTTVVGKVVAVHTLLGLRAVVAWCTRGGVAVIADGVVGARRTTQPVAMGGGKSLTGLNFGVVLSTEFFQQEKGTRTHEGVRWELGGGDYQV